MALSIPPERLGDTLQSALNVAVFTPLAIYTLRGKKPPDALVLAAIVTLAVGFARDLGSLLSAPERPPEALSGIPLLPPSGSGALAPVAMGAVQPRRLAPDIRRLYTYRVNRSGPLR